MAVYRFRVTFEDYDDVSRDIEIRPTQTFEDLNYAIQNAIGFDATKIVSFFMSDDNWKKGKEISSRSLSEEDAGRVAIMKKSRLCDFIVDPHQKIYCIFDPAALWSFKIELFKILPAEDPFASYPRCIKVTGEAPKQYQTSTPEILPVPEDFDADLGEETEEDIEEEVLGTSEDELPEGEEVDKSFITVADGSTETADDFETAEEDLLDDETPAEGEEF